ncbi:hypothetical protein PIB30_062803 [Stylosanthes scabra]|uniref:Uncharacterized protein n=1 Tax=Stylosanthes scabra TaxID=79078 RepID=A0ABU6XJV0_9FABA|nr:hypothetical protein [Stylosanthes scabra]
MKQLVPSEESNESEIEKRKKSYLEVGGHHQEAAFLNNEGNGGEAIATRNANRVAHHIANLTLKRSDLNIGAVCGDFPRPRSKKRSQGEEIPFPEGDNSSKPLTTPEKEVDQRNNTIQQLEAALRELLERQT